MREYHEWRTILKLDPGRALGEERLEEVCSWPVDGVIIGGSGGYGPGEVASLQRRLRRYHLPVGLEVSDIEAICPDFDLYFVPVALNSRDVDWVVGHHQAAFKRLGALPDRRKVVAEGYCILNPDATAARLCHARTDLDVDDVVAFARLAQDLLRLPIFYLEYSGTYGHPELVAAVGKVLDSTLLWYGGGICTRQQAGEMSQTANAIVIGNAVYEACSPF